MKQKSIDNNFDSKLVNTLRTHQGNFGKVLDLDFNQPNFVILDLSKNNKELAKVNLSSAEEFNSYIKSKLKNSHFKFAIGKYAEDRTIYGHSELFSSDRRTIHLGIDIWTEQGVKVLAPLEGEIHSFANNKGDGDYGPTIILEHNLKGTVFYTLYGHLSLDSLDNIKINQKFNKGEVIGQVGNYPSNGNWPPHLHFQIIADMLGKKGDFPGVASQETREKFLKICPNPNLILRIPGLELAP